MPSAIEQYMARLRRTLSKSATYRVTGVNEPYVNQTLDRCLVLERVGAGAMSVVYKAKQEYTDRIVAIKMLRSQLCYDLSNVKRFQREAKAIARLSHTNLLNVYSVGATSNGQPYIVMDYVQGKSLTDVIEADGQIEWKRCATIFMQVCDAMQHAHAHRIIHRDLKPDNIMLVDSPAAGDVVKVVDFGIVKITDESQALSQRLTKTGEVWGSPVYMSPEQCMGHELDHRSDIYALGTVLYECLLGKPVFDGKRITDIIMKQLNDKPASFSAVRPDLDIPAWFEQVVQKALEKEPAKRFQSMEEFKRAIEKGLLSRKDTAELLRPMEPAPVVEPQRPAASAQLASRSVTATRPDFLVGTVVGGKYNVKSLVGEGGMSIVYRAVQDGINRSVAIKLLRSELCDDDANVKRFKRESKAVSQLSHPNLVAIYDVGVIDTGQPYMVMEFLEGRSMMDELENRGPMAPDRAIPIFVQICDVMNYAHNKGFFHRDLKPHNVMLVKAGEKPDFVKLVDFGIVAMDGERQAISQKLTAAGEICGSPIYMSPEQVLDEPVDGRSDIYSLGIMMYECLAGRPAFGGKRITDVMQKHINSPPPPFAESCPDANIPPALEGVVFKALEKKPDNRYQSMEQLKRALLNVSHRTDSRPGSASLGFQNPARTPVAPLSPHKEVVTPKASDKAAAQRGLIVLLVVIAVGAVLAAGVAFAMFSNHKPSAPPVISEPQVETAKTKSTITIEDDPKPVVKPVSATPKQSKPKSRPVAKPKRETLVDVIEAEEDANIRPHSDEYQY